MKRIISFILVLCLLFSVCGCKREDPENTAAPLDITEQKIENRPELPEDKTEPEQTEPDDKTEPEQPKGDKAEPCNLTLENTFSQYEVIVTLTKEETEKGKEYTAKDFADYDVFYVLENDAYYGNPSFKDSYPEYQDKTTLFMYLNEPSKENVLNTVKALEKDERVFAACPCPFNSRGTLIAYLTNEGEEKANKQELGEKDFNIDNVTSVMHNSGCIRFSFGELFKENQDNTYTSYKKLVNNPYIEKVIPDYSEYSSYVIISMDIKYYNSNVHTQEFFSKFTEMNIIKFKKIIETEYSYSKELFIYFENPTYQQLFDMVSAVRKYDENLLAHVDEKNSLIDT